MKYLLDTYLPSALVRRTPDIHALQWFQAQKEHELCSVMTLAELQHELNKLPEPKRRSELALWLPQLETGFEDRVLPFGRKVAQVWAQMTV